MRYLRVNGCDAEMNVLTDPKRRALEKKVVDERKEGWWINGEEWEEDEKSVDNQVKRSDRERKEWWGHGNATVGKNAAGAEVW